MTAFVVIVEVVGVLGSQQAVGPYRTFKKAEGDAKAWDYLDGRRTHVLPIVSPQQYAISQLKKGTL
jgi:hypothetical protein